MLSFFRKKIFLFFYVYRSNYTFIQIKKQKSIRIINNVIYLPLSKFFSLYYYFFYYYYLYFLLLTNSSYNAQQIKIDSKKYQCIGYISISHFIYFASIFFTFPGLYFRAMKTFSFSGYLTFAGRELQRRQVLKRTE